MGPAPTAAQLARWRRYDTKTSPFLELQTPFTWWEAVKMVCILWTVIPRACIGIGACVVLAIMSYIAALGVPLDQPFPPWRRRIVVLSSYLAGVVVYSLGFVIRVKGRENIKKGREVGALAVFNHISWVDPIAIMWLLCPSGVSKASNADIPLIGTCIKAYQNVYVPRESIDSKKTPATTSAPSNGAPTKSVATLIRDRARDTRFPMLSIAPEGTCGTGRCILEFRTGAFVPGVPVLPVLFSYAKKHHNPAWTIIYEYWHFVRLACQWYNYMEITVLPPYIPSEAEKKDPLLYATNVRKLFAKTLGVPLVDQSQADYIALLKSGVRVSWDGRRVIAPPGVVDKDGFADLTLKMKKTS